MFNVQRNQAPGMVPQQNSLSVLERANFNISALYAAPVKFEDMPEDARNKVAEFHTNLDKFCKQQNEVIRSLQNNPLTELNDLQQKLHAANETHASLETELQLCKVKVVALRSQSSADAREAASRGGNATFTGGQAGAGNVRQQQPLQHLFAGVNDASLNEFFASQMVKLEGRLQATRKALNEISNNVKTRYDEQATNPQVLSQVIQQENEAFLSLAGEMAALHEHVEILKEDFQRVMRHYGVKDDAMFGAQ
eukprot:Clim_evm26s22 gene=Clim_evmTU26s22